jgi:glyoxylase-like metal-dependent hydrolase (beta-lactamase superfamily II)
MRIHHLNCTSMCPLGGALMDGRSRSLTARLVCHCLLLETDAAGLVLIDTGFGTRDVEQPQVRLSGVFRHLLRPHLREHATAIYEVKELGFSPQDVRHIVLTHLDFDHAGGLDDFPHAAVHLMAAERDHAEAQRSALDRQRFRPQQWRSRERWVTYRAQGERWFGFDCVRAIEGLRDEVLLVPLHGHTFGHAGVAVHGPSGPLLHCGDAYFHHAEMDPARYHCPPGLRAYQALMEVDRPQRLWNQTRLRELANREAGKVHLFCAHDPVELEQARARAQPELYPGRQPLERPGEGAQQPLSLDR